MDIVLHKVEGCEDKAEAQQECDQTGGAKDDDVAGVVEGGQLYQDVGKYDIGGEVLQDEDELSTLPSTLHTITSIVIQSLGTPREIIYAAEREHLQQVDVGR